MGQKVNPIAFRLGVIRSWESNWFDEKHFSTTLSEDLFLRKYILKRLPKAGIARIGIERTSKKVTLDLEAARPGLIIGKKGQEVDLLKEELKRITKKDIQLNVNEIKKPELNAKLVAENIARQLEARASFRKVMKKAIQTTMRMGADGIRVSCSGRLGGAEMARTEQYREGRVPLHTLRSDIDYAIDTANTTFGCIGIKVWICKGEVYYRQDNN
ncbi:30S ribosomal protein S3 [bacterium]|nr:30S ribosomal protein S3 [bacterium]